MVNSIKVVMRDAILGLWRQGWSYRRIARELGVHRKTVARHVRLAKEGSKWPNPTAGTDRPTEAECGTCQSPPAGGSPPGRSGPASRCGPFREIVVEKLDAGLSAQRIWQDLVADHGFAASYESVKRFCRRLGAKRELPFRRIEVEPGAECQVDFAKGAPVMTSRGRRRRPHVLRVVLSFSRRGYSRGVWKQTTDEFLGALEDSFWHFGGVPKTVVTDNLKAAVTKADWFDPELNPKIEVFARHYGTTILPTKPYTPRHKGKIEAGVKYVQSNALKGKAFENLEEHNRHLLDWETDVADLRIHGTTRKQVLKLFEESERAALLPLPDERFPFFHEAERTVHRDGHVEVEKAYYSTPPEYVGRRVWVRWDTRLVRIFNQRFDELIVHPKVGPGRFKTHPSHVPAEKVSAVERGAGHLLKRASLVGPQAGRWAEAVMKSRGIPGMRTVQGLLSLARKHTSAKIDRACRLALGHGAFRLRDVRALIDSREEQTEFEFMSEHPIIRNMHEYGRVVRVSFEQTETRVVPISAAPRTRPAPGATGARGGSSLCQEGGET